MLPLVGVGLPQGSLNGCAHSPQCGSCWRSTWSRFASWHTHMSQLLSAALFTRRYMEEADLGPAGGDEREVLDLASGVLPARDQMRRPPTSSRSLSMSRPTPPSTHECHQNSVPRPRRPPSSPHRPRCRVRSPSRPKHDPSRPRAYAWRPCQGSCCRAVACGPP